MKIEYITRICLTSWRSAEKQGKCTISRCVFTQIIINNEHILSVFHPFLTDCTSCIRCNILKRSQVTCRTRNNGCICHRAVFRQGLHDICNGRCLLTDCYVNAVYALPLLIDNRIHRDCRLTGLSVSDNKLTLSSSDWNHGIDCLDTGLKRCINRFTGDNTGCHSLNLSCLGCLDRAFAIDWLSQCIYDTSKHCVANRYLNHAACCFYYVALADILAFTEENRSYIIFLQVHNHAVYFTREFQKFALHRILKSVNTCNTISHLNNGSDIGCLQLRLVVFDLFFYD